MELTQNLFKGYQIKVKSEHKLKQECVDSIIELAHSQGCDVSVKEFYGLLSPFMQKKVPLQSLEKMRKGCLDYKAQGGKVIAYVKVSLKKTDPVEK